MYVAERGVYGYHYHVRYYMAGRHYVSNYGAVTIAYSNTCLVLCIEMVITWGRKPVISGAAYCVVNYQLVLKSYMILGRI